MRPETAYGLESLDELLAAGNELAGERRQFGDDRGADAATSQQRHEERCFLEVVRDVVGGLHEFLQVSGPRIRAHRVTHVIDEPVGIGLPSLTARGKLLGEFLTAAAAECQQRVSHGVRYLDGESGVLAEKVENTFARASQMAQQLRPQLVLDQRLGPTDEQLACRRLQCEFEKESGTLFAEQIVERLPEVTTSADRKVQCIEHRAGSADLQEPHMSNVLKRSPIEKPCGGFLTDERAQLLASPVPVDQEDQSRAEELEESRDQQPVGIGVMADGHVIRAIRHLLVLDEARVLPSDGVVPE